MSVTVNLHVERQTEVVGRTCDEMHYTSLVIDTLGVGGATIFFSRHREPEVKMSAIITKCIKELKAQKQQHLAWEAE